MRHAPFDHLGQYVEIARQPATETAPTSRVLLYGGLLGVPYTCATGTMIHGQDIQWQRPYIDRGTRWRVLGLSGATVWFTGLPAAGKSTIAGLVERRLVEGGVAAYRLDGDNLRHGLNGDLGFGAEDRSENVRRTAHAARLLADAGMVVLVGLISPYAGDRRQARELHERNDLPFFEVYVSTPLTVCEQRDPKRLYERARRGEIHNMTGVDDPYEPPETPALVITPGPIEEQVEAVLTLLDRSAPHRPRAQA